MTFEEIQNLLKGGPKTLPAPSLKEDWKKVFERMVVHSRGVPPSDLLKKTFPNEEREIMEYREANYEPITTGSFDKGFDNLYRAMSESNYSLVAPDDLKDYLKNLMVDKIAFWQFLFKIVLRRKIEDPNGLLVPIPYGEGIDKPTIAVEVKLELVLSSQIVFWNEGAIIFKSKEKSLVSAKEGRKRIEYNVGDIYYVITDTDYFKYYQIGEKEKETYILEEWYTHDLGEKPLVVLGGRPSGRLDFSTGEEQFYFNSDFDAFVAHANEALRDKSIHQGVKVTSAYPIRIMQDMPCDNKKCVSGQIYNQEATKSVKCSRCNGTGSLIPTSVYKGIILKQSKNNPLNGSANQKALEYVYPDVAILKHMGEESDSALEKAERALQTKFIELAQSGTAKEIDREDQYSMLYSFSDYWFDVVCKKTVGYIYKLLRPTGKDEITIIKPVSFNIKDEQTLLGEFTTALAQNAPVGVLVDIYLDYIKKRFSGDKVQLKIEEAAIVYDPFYIYPIQTKNELKMSGVMDANDYIKSVRVNYILRAIYQEKKDAFFEMSDEAIIKEIDKRIAPFLQVLTPPALPDFGKNDKVITDTNDPNYDATKDPNSDEYIEPTPTA